ncbi:carboxypeptidase-like regulatory domain-containing protein [Prevotella melaninogenica]|uniref:carboxypeptidase-like regulatory domain-containing protein n=1 Tax=Prevotella melaninogenica TaxID=28132 RepID=UPI001C5DC226|nr:carboxypeptidase-like regulatory domain-containing protein [Prevotella melaninogenica]MBW4741222.1 carboxypeptidase-like regulatory domain-containing protein [Prevotella melaninogenica]MBW4912882.1 carboxypeptidase-like regulatory domain-containing protein [Prevotella melaninogenica]
MVKGKSTCKLLKDIRQQIADANGISYQPKECHYEGDCAGTCPACEEEIRYLERELKTRKGNGFGMKVAGIAAGICATVMPMTAAAQAVKPDSTANPPVQTTKKAPIKVVDLSDGCASPVVVRGMVIDAEDKEPVIGASVVIDGTNKGVATNVDGQFALKLPPDTSLVISYIGYKTKKVHVSSLLHSNNNVIVLEADDLSGLSCIVGGVVTVLNYDDVYGHRTYKPKTHKEKNKKKCK